MKTLHGLFAAVLGLCALSFAAPAEAGQYDTFAGVASLFPGTTNDIVQANTLTNYATQPRIDVPRSEYVTLEASFKLVSGSATTNIVFNFVRSLDGTTNETVTAFTWGVPANGTTRVQVMTNILVGAVPYIFLKGVTNGNDAALTNLQVRYGFKR
jgi:hypothetical protein